MLIILFIDCVKPAVTFHIYNYIYESCASFIMKHKLNMLLTIIPQKEKIAFKILIWNRLKNIGMLK